ncbi:hypothetical protein ACVIYL_003048 [Bradyrhizobium sp. USDA 3315]
MLAGCGSFKDKPRAALTLTENGDSGRAPFSISNSWVRGDRAIERAVMGAPIEDGPNRPTDGSQDYNLTGAGVSKSGRSASAMTTRAHRALSSNDRLDGAPHLEHGQFTPLAGPRVERNGLIDRKSEKRGADRRQHGDAPTRDVCIKRINQNDLLSLSGLFVPTWLPRLTMSGRSFSAGRTCARSSSSRRYSHTSVIGPLVSDDNAESLAKWFASIAIGGLISTTFSRCISYSLTFIERLSSLCALPALGGLGTIIRPGRRG